MSDIEVDVNLSQRTLQILFLTIAVIAIILGIVHLSSEKVPAARTFESIQTLRPCR